MKKAFIALCLLVASCCAPPEVGTEVATPVAPDEVASGPNSLPMEDEFMVRVNMAVLDSYEDDYPVMYQALMDAIQEWSGYLPVEFGVYKIGPKSGAFMPLGTTRVQMFDFHDEPDDNKIDYVGLFSFAENALRLDVADLQGDYDRSRAVILHEMGHMFGLSHVYGQNDRMARTGDIRLDIPTAKGYIMFYSSADGVDPGQKKLSELEIKLARDYILNILRTPNH
jgi:hypothetical protein